MNTPSMTPASSLADDNEATLQFKTPSSPSMDANASNLSSSRQSYNTGHGDFYFGRLEDRNKFLEPSPDFIQASSGVPVIEVGVFQRIGSFEFFKLPIEIRRKIYRLLLGPFYEYNSETRTSFINLDFTIFPGRNWQKEKDAGYIRHPHRTSSYGIVARPQRRLEPQSWWRAKQDYIFIEWIRQVSSVSSLFRKELGDEFWNNVTIGVAAGHSGGEYAHFNLVGFLKERPAIHQSIKSLHVYLDFMAKTTPFKSSSNFEAWIAYMSNVLTLDSLHITFYIDDEEIAQLGRGEGRFSYVVELRKLRVRKGLYCWGKVHTHTFDDFYTDNEEAREEYEVKLWEKWQPRIKELTMPDTLRTPLAQSEMEKYLGTRL